MLKWTCAALGLGWAASILYEGAWGAWSAGQYVSWTMVGAAITLGLLLLILARERRTGKPWTLRPMEWFLMAALVVAMIYSGLEHTAKGELTHVPVLPMYIVLFVDFLGAGLHGWWRKDRKR